MQQLGVAASEIIVYMYVHTTLYAGCTLKCHSTARTRKQQQEPEMERAVVACFNDYLHVASGKKATLGMHINNKYATCLLYLMRQCRESPFHVPPGHVQLPEQLARLLSF